MRYVIEVSDETLARTLGIMLEEKQREGKVRILDKGDPLNLNASFKLGFVTLWRIFKNKALDG